MKPLLLILCTLALAAQDLHKKAFVFDAHVHMINRQFYKGGDIGQRVEDGQVDLPRAKEGGLDAMFFTLFVEEQYYPARYETKHVLRLLDLARRQVAANSDKIQFAYTAQDVTRIAKTGKIAAVLDLEGGFDLDGDLGVLRELYHAGFRVMQLPAHNWANNFAESCCSKSLFGGLNEHGKDVVREMNRLGMLINVAHASEKATRDVLAVSTRPIMATHTGLRRFNNLPRTMSDELLKEIAAKGGVIGFHSGCEFHYRPMFDYRTSQAGKAFWDTTAIEKQPKDMTILEVDALVKNHHPMVGIKAPDSVRCSIDQWLEPVEAAIQIAGEDHVALGSDLDGGPTFPLGIRDVRDFPKLTEAMQRRGWSETRIRKFLGGNTLRVFGAATDPAGKR
ncbi:MAG TPA: membrane dipeptidase [Bryobacteraceae bacterium]|nr:membrane dipeptidase [Bryobacteraceae bacterium]